MNSPNSKLAHYPSGGWFSRSLASSSAFGYNSTPVKRAALLDRRNDNFPSQSCLFFSFFFSLSWLCSIISPLISMQRLKQADNRVRRRLKFKGNPESESETSESEQVAVSLSWL